jgi:hypothetical protein
MLKIYKYYTFLRKYSIFFTLNKQLFFVLQNRGNNNYIWSMFSAQNHLGR